MKKKTKLPNPVLVKWLDHFSKQGWGEADDCQPIEVSSVGYVIKDTKKMLVLAQDAHYESGYAGFGNNIAIMKGCIVSKKAIK